MKNLRHGKAGGFSSMRTRPTKSSGLPVPESETKVTLQIEGHRTVLLHEAVSSLNIKPMDTIVDATLGGAGHALSMANLLNEKGTFVGFDLDSDALERSKKILAGVKPRVELIHANFRELSRELDARSIGAIDGALFDLGWSTFQLNVSRGFSFMRDEPLHMTYGDPAAALFTARTIVNDWAENSIADVIYGWGEERFARRIARNIVEYRQKKAIETSGQLAEIVRFSIPAPARNGRTHPATKTFQALRIAVNDELGALKDGLFSAWQRLNAGGRLAVITFHSLEDRVVKRQFQEWAKEDGELVYKKPLPPTLEEVRSNPRARSAKLRVIEKKNPKEI